jgi:hypothetical protein
VLGGANHRERCGMIAGVTSMVGRTLLVAIALAASTGLAREANAEIPYLDQLTPGELRGIAWQPGDEWGYGYWEYLPSNFDDLGPDERVPLLVFLAGIGEYDDVPACPGGVDVCAASDCGNDGLCRNLTWGPQSLMRAGNWDDTARPFIFISPQHPVAPFSVTDWDIEDLDAFFEWVVANYPVDPRRLYLTGMSQGGRCTLQYTFDHPRRFTAVAPLPGGVVQFPSIGCYFQDTGLWVFHGENDNDSNLGVGTFAPCEMVEVVDQYDHPEDYPGTPACDDAVGQPHPPGRVSMFDNVQHSSWIQAIDPVGSGFPASEWLVDQGCGLDVNYHEYSAANDPDGVYSWFLGLDRPDVTAPEDVVLPGEQTSTSLLATVVDDDAITFEWTQTAGPPATLVVADQAQLELDDLEPLGAYTFEVYALDADGQWDRDTVDVTLLEAPVGGSTTTESSTGDPSGGPSTDPTASSTGDPSESSTGDPSESSTGDPSAGPTSDPSIATTSDSSDGASETTDGGTTSGATTSTDGSTSTTSEGTSSGTSSTGSASTDESGSSVTLTTTPGSADDTSSASASATQDDTADGGPSDASASADSADESSESSGSPIFGEENPGCGCDAARSSPRDAAWALPFVLLGLRRRRRQPS